MTEFCPHCQTHCLCFGFFHPIPQIPIPPFFPDEKGRIRDTHLSKRVICLCSYYRAQVEIGDLDNYLLPNGCLGSVREAVALIYPLTGPVWSQTGHSLPLRTLSLHVK